MLKEAYGVPPAIVACARSLSGSLAQGRADR
jgi:hypothetical protein